MTSGTLFEVTPSAAPPQTLDAKTAAEAIAALRPSFQRCWRDALAATPGISGSMRLDVEVKPDGSVGKVQPSGVNGLPPSVVDCVTRVVTASQFPPSKNGAPTILTIPIAFTPTPSP